MTERIVGKCGNCVTGVVVLPIIWHGIYPPRPKCKSCGSVALEPALPTIPMEPRKQEFRNGQLQYKIDYWTPNSLTALGY